MNIDERLEALTQTVEILAGMQRDNDKLFDRIEAVLTQTVETMGRNAAPERKAL